MYVYGRRLERKMEAREMKSCLCNTAAIQYYNKLAIQFGVELKWYSWTPINQSTVTWEVHGRVAQSLSFER